MGEISKPIATDPTLLAAPEKARSHVMTPVESQTGVDFLSESCYTFQSEELHMLQISLTACGQLSVDLQGHHVTIPCSLTGLIYLRSLLHDRAREEASGAKIGTRFVPTQAMVDAFIASHRVAPPPPAFALDLEITL